MAGEQPPKGRRYVGTAESLGFILFDLAAKIPYGENAEFVDRVLNIDVGVRALLTPVIQAWDLSNDLFLAALVDKTRTRWGKFKPYLVLYPVYGLPVSLAMFLLPYIFAGSDNTFVPKIAAWFVIWFLRCISGTIASIARTGMIANLTPNAEERITLITKAQFFSMFAENLPKQIFDVFRDIIARSGGRTALEISTRLRSLFLVFGVSTTLIAGLFSLYFALVAKERVFGSEIAKEKPPTIRESLVALKNNRPLLMLMLADILNGFTLRSQIDTYTRSILNFANFDFVSGIPGSPVSFASFAYVPRLRERFSTKALWVAGDYVNSPMQLLIYIYGMVRVRNPAKLARGVTHRFLDLTPMLIAFGIQNTVDMTLWGTKKVIRAEIRNECIDYGEWKNGFRAEAMVGVLRGMPVKVTGMFGGAMTGLVMKLVGFQTGVNYNNQTARTARGVFAMATIVPAFMSLVSLAPKLLYNLNRNERERMYTELAGRRAAVAAAHGEGVRNG